MSLRNRAKPATYTLSQSLAELERTDPAVAKAAANLDRVTHDLLAAFKAAPSVVATTWPVINALNANGTRWREDEPRGNTYLRERHEALTCALTQPCAVRCEYPAQLTSVGNRKDISVAAMHARRVSVKAKRELGERIARQFLGHVFKAPFYVVVLTRIAPRQLDSDNLESALKAVRDGIATGLSIDDRSSLVRYVTSQEQGAPRYCAVRAELFIQPKHEVSTTGEAP